MEAIGQRIKKLRKDLRLTQKQLAPQLGIDQSTLSDIERGASFGGDVLIALANALFTTPHYIMAGGTERDRREAELLGCYRAMSETDRTHLLASARAFAGLASPTACIIKTKSYAGPDRRTGDTPVEVNHRRTH